MNKSTKLIFSTFFLVLFQLIAYAQSNTDSNQRTIIVSGKASFNLSPDEIILDINYQEYFKGEEKSENKVLIETIEKEVLGSLKATGISSNKITMGAAFMVRPNKDGKVYLKRRLNKSLTVCISNTEDYIKLIRQLEKDQLFDKVITTFRINSYRHTEQEAYKKKCKAAAFENAKENANLILGNSNNKLGKVLTIIESNSRKSNTNTYDFDNSSSNSGFKAIEVNYSLTVKFEIE